MKNFALLILFFASIAAADTPPPGTVKAKTYSGDGATSITATSGALDVNVKNSAALTNVVVTGSVLPTNAAQEAGGHLASIDTKTTNPNGAPAAAAPALATQVGGSDGTNLRALKVSSTGVVSVDGSASTQPISAASLPLPSGAATSALQTSILGALGSPFQAGGSIGNSAFGISGTLPAYASTPTFNLGTLNGAATAALQTSGNASLTSIDGKTPALGQALSAASVPVVLPAAQITTLTPLSSVTVTQATGSNLNAVVTGTVTTVPSTPSALTIKQAAISVGTSAVRLTTDGSAPSSTRVLLAAQLISTSTANCYFGSSSVASSGASRGVQMFAGQTFSFSDDAGDYYAICDTTAQTVLVSEQE